MWLDAELDDDGLVHFRADSDAIIVKGIISLLVSVLDGHTPDEILAADLHFIDEIGLSRHLSPTRSNGLWPWSSRCASTLSPSRPKHRKTNVLTLQ